MTEYTQWCCDYHASDGPHDDGDLLYQDDARDKGWAAFERREFKEVVLRAIPGTSVEETVLPARWRTEERHVCANCMADPECQEWLSGWTPQFAEDENAYGRAKGEADARA